jgi:hypothetical protein
MKLRSSSGQASVLIAAAIAAGGALLVAAVTLFYPHGAEKEAILTEAGYLCNALAWEAYYVASDEPPDNWKAVRSAEAATQDFSQYPARLEACRREPGPAGSPLCTPWDRPLFPYSTPAWDKLRDKAGDLGTDAGPLTDFYNRIGFINMLKRARDCYSNGDARFVNNYLCAIKTELQTCKRQNYGDQECTWFSGLGVWCKTHHGEQYSAIEKGIGGVCTAPTPYQPALDPACAKIKEDSESKK